MLKSAQGNVLLEGGEFSVRGIFRGLGELFVWRLFDERVSEALFSTFRLVEILLKPTREVAGVDQPTALDDLRILVEKQAS